MYMNNHITRVFKFIISLKGLNIMVTLISVYFEYIKKLCYIFTNYIVPILQIYPHNLIMLLKFITNDIYYYYYYYYYYVITLIKCNKKFKKFIKILK